MLFEGRKKKKKKKGIKIFSFRKRNNEICDWLDDMFNLKIENSI